MAFVMTTPRRVHRLSHRPPPLVAAIAAHAPVPLIVAVALIGGGTGTFFNTMWFTALQRAVPQAELSRVSSWDYVGSIVLLPLGQAASGPIAATIGLFAAAGLAILMLIAVLAVPAVRNFNQPSPPKARPDQLSCPARSLSSL